MQSVLDVNSEADDLGVLLDELTTKPALLEGDIQRLRHAFYRRDFFDRRGAAMIFHTNRIMRACDNSWTEFYLEAITDFFLDGRTDEIILPAESETTLLAWLGNGVAITDLGERRLISRMYLRLDRGSERLERRLFDALKENLLHRTERWLGGAPRSAGVIDALDMQLIRRLASVDREDDRRAVSHIVAEFFLDLNRNAERFADSESWRRLLIATLARHLAMDCPSGSEAGPISDDRIPTRLVEMLDCGEERDEIERLRRDIRSTMAPSMFDGRDDGAVISRSASTP